MSRTLIALSVLCALAVGAAAAPIIGLLDEMVPWPMLSAAIPMRPLALHDRPPEELLGAPVVLDDASAARYGLIPLGDTEDDGLSIAVVIGEEIRVLVDTDGDGDLADEPGGYPCEQVLAHTSTWFVTVTPRYDAAAGASRAAYHLSITADYSYMTDRYEFYYGGFCHRRGAVLLDGVVVPVAITSQASTGRYDDLSVILCAIDTDGDGLLDTLPGSHEVYLPGQPLQVGTQTYRIESISPDGRRMELAPADSAAPRLPVGLGMRAPDFGGTTPDGAGIRLSDCAGSVVVLVLGRSVASPSCPGCDAPAEAPPTREDTLSGDLARYGDRIVTLRVFGPGDSMSPPDTAEGAAAISVISEEAFAAYRRPTGVFVIDREGVVVAMDEPWATVRCGRPSGKLDLLSVAEILTTVERLLGL